MNINYTVLLVLFAFLLFLKIGIYVSAKRINFAVRTKRKNTTQKKYWKLDRLK